MHETEKWLYCIILDHMHLFCLQVVLWTNFLTFPLFSFIFRENCRMLFTSGTLTEFAHPEMLCLQVDVHWWCTPYPNFLVVGSTLKRLPNRRYRLVGRNVGREDHILVIIQCLTFVALPWQKTVFIHQPLQRKPLIFTCSYVLTYVPKFKKLFYWIKWLNVSTFS